MQRNSLLDVRIDRQGRPHFSLEPGDRGQPPHDVLIEHTAPYVAGFCTTCFEHHLADRRRAARKARNCRPMVAYLSAVNRDSRMREGLLAECRRVRDLEQLGV